MDYTILRLEESARPGNALVPWYAIIWRALWASAFYGGLALAWIAICASHGHRRARRFWIDTV